MYAQNLFNEQILAFVTECTRDVSVIVTREAASFPFFFFFFNVDPDREKKRREKKKKK